MTPERVSAFQFILVTETLLYLVFKNQPLDTDPVVICPALLALISVYLMKDVVHEFVKLVRSQTAYQNVFGHSWISVTVFAIFQLSFPFFERLVLYCITTSAAESARL